jgi:two-component system sensor histidine kinase KdpD
VTEDARSALRKLRPYLYAAAIVIVCTVVGLPLRDRTASNNLTMIFLTGVVVAAARLGIGPAIMASVLGLAAFNFFFAQPYYSFTFDSHYYWTFAVMLVTSLLVGSLTAQVAGSGRVARQREQETRLLYRLARELAAVRGADNMQRVAAAVLSGPYRAEIRFGGQAPANGLSVPLLCEGENLGNLQVTASDGNRFTAVERLQFETFAALIAAALLRARQADAAEAAHIESENEKLRNVLLASVSHDLRTPLTVLNGGLSNLLRLRKKLPREAVDEVSALWRQLDRLQRFVDNLLRLAALTSGRMQLNRQPYLIQEIIGSALTQAGRLKGDRNIKTVVNGALPMVEIDGALIEQVLINLLDNGIRHTADTGTLTITADRDGTGVRIGIADDGPGLPEGREGQLFDAFHTDRAAHGTGLGLAICRGIVEAHGGRIHAETLRAEGGRPTGACFVFTLPGAPK